MESAPYDSAKLQRSKERVELLGYFDNVQFDAVPVANAPDQADPEHESDRTFYRLARLECRLGSGYRFGNRLPAWLKTTCSAR